MPVAAPLASTADRGPSVLMSGQRNDHGVERSNTVTRVLGGISRSSAPQKRHWSSTTPVEVTTCRSVKRLFTATASWRSSAGTGGPGVMQLPSRLWSSTKSSEEQLSGAPDTLELVSGSAVLYQ